MGGFLVSYLVCRKEDKSRLYCCSSVFTQSDIPALTPSELFSTIESDLHLVYDSRVLATLLSSVWLYVNFRRNRLSIHKLENLLLTDLDIV